MNSLGFPSPLPVRRATRADAAGRWRWRIATGFALLLAAGAARADDTDIYRTLPPTTKLLTILSVDLNVPPATVLCDNVLVDPAATASGITDPEKIANCSAIRAGVTLGTFIDTLRPYLTVPPAPPVPGAPMVDPSNPTTPNPADVIEAALRAGGPLSGQLATPIGQLTNSAQAYLAAALALLPPTPFDPKNPAVPAVPPSTAPYLAYTQQQTLIAIAAELARGLVGGKLALMINHANVGQGTKAGDVTYACDFRDVVNANTLDPSVSRNRKDTLNCSNGAYFLMGLTDLGDLTTSTAASASATRDKAVDTLTNALGDAVASAMGLIQDQRLTLPGITLPPRPTIVNTEIPVPDDYSPDTSPLLPPYQGREVYEEVGRYLQGLQTFNAKLNTYDFAVGKKVTLPAVGLPPELGGGSVGGTTNVLVGAPIARDTSIESSDSYVSPLATAPSCDINLVHVQTSNSRLEPDSDPDLPKTFDAPDLNGDGKLTYAEMSQAAAQRGFVWNDRRYKLKSTFLIQQTLTDALNLNLGNNAVFPFTDLLGLLGSVRGIGKQLSPTLTDSTTMTGLARPNRIDLYDTAGTPVFEAMFQPVADQKPNWIGNVKRLEMRYNATTQRFGVFGAGTSSTTLAYDPDDGRLARNLSTGFGSNGDGRRVDRGGAGAQIPGYIVPVFNGAGQRTNRRGDPGLTNARSLRRLYTDQMTAQVTVTNPVTGATTVVTPATLRRVDLNDTDNITATTELNLELIARQIGATSTCVVPAAANYQRQQQALDAVLYARGYEIGTSTTTPGAATCETVPPAFNHHLTETCPFDTTRTDCSGARDWLMGAVLHSRPVAINYGGTSAATADVRVLVGSADGFLRMINGQTGRELWGFMPSAALAQQPTLRKGAAITNLPYGLDGPVSVSFIDRNANGRIDTAVDSVIAYFGLRRSGNTYYALDITDPNGPPRLLWRLGSDGLYSFLAAGTSAGTATTLTYTDVATQTLPTLPAAAYGTMGLAFSQPSVGRVRLCATVGTGSGCTLEANPRTVLLLGGGYNGRTATGTANAAKDLNNSSNTTLTPTDQRVGKDDTVGNAVYVVDAASGELLWRAERGAFSATTPFVAGLYSHPMLADGITAPLNTIDNTGDGLTDRTYFGDLGGRVWRMDMASPDRAQWTLTPLASLGRQATPGSFADDRRFSAGIDYVPTRIGQVPYDALVFGSGDREDPRNTVTKDALYALFDPDTTNGRVVTDATTYDGVIALETDSRLFKQARFGAPCTNTTACNLNLPTSAADTSASRNAGWTVALPVSGQKVVSQPVTTSGTVYLTSYIPGQVTTNFCIPLEGYSAASTYFLASGVVDKASLLLITDTSKNSGSVSSNSNLTAGYAGASTPVDAANVLVPGRGNSVNLAVRRNYLTSWRERRGDEP